MSGEGKEKRWDQMTSKQRCFVLFKKVDLNTRALAKLASAIAYLNETEVEVGSGAPDLYVAIRTIVRERRNLKAALESELARMWAEAHAAKAVHP